MSQNGNLNGSQADQNGYMVNQVRNQVWPGDEYEV